MLSGPGWRPDAIARLLLGVFVCVYTGSLVTSTLAFHPGPAQPAARFYLFLARALGCLAVALGCLRRPWSFDDFRRRAAPLLLSFYAGLTFGSFAQRMAGPVAPSASQMLVAALSFQGCALVLGGVFLREHQTTWVAGFGLREDWRRALRVGLVAALIFVPAAWIMQQGSALVLERLTFLPWGAQEQEAVQTLRDTTGWGRRASMGVITIFLAPVAEEFLFRGVLFTGIRQMGHPRAALWITSLLFAVVHWNAMTFLPLMVFALVLARLYERTGNLLAPITTHAMFNAVNFSLLMLSS